MTVLPENLLIQGILKDFLCLVKEILIIVVHRSQDGLAVESCGAQPAADLIRGPHLIFELVKEPVRIDAVKIPERPDNVIKAVELLSER